MRWRTCEETRAFEEMEGQQTQGQLQLPQGPAMIASASCQRFGATRHGLLVPRCECCNAEDNEGV